MGHLQKALLNWGHFKLNSIGEDFLFWESLWLCEFMPHICVMISFWSNSQERICFLLSPIVKVEAWNFPVVLCEELTSCLTWHWDRALSSPAFKSGASIRLFCLDNFSFSVAYNKMVHLVMNDIYVFICIVGPWWKVQRSAYLVVNMRYLNGGGVKEMIEKGLKKIDWTE